MKSVIESIAFFISKSIIVQIKTIALTSFSIIIIVFQVGHFSYFMLYNLLLILIHSYTKVHNTNVAWKKHLRDYAYKIPLIISIIKWSKRTPNKKTIVSNRNPNIKIVFDTDVLEVILRNFEIHSWSKRKPNMKTIVSKRNPK